MRAVRRPDGGLARWLEDEGAVPVAGGAGAIADVGHVRALLVSAAMERRAFSYSELLDVLGHRFTRPKMRALCRTLDAIDLAGAAAGEPALAVLVVRESDGLPGQGWWIGRDAPAWQGVAARAYVDERQAAAFAYWTDQPVKASR